MEKKQKNDGNKQFDVDVMKLLVSNGILNSIQAKLVTEISSVVANSEFEAMKPYREIRTDIDNQIATEIVFEYLRKHNMTETIRCIELETKGKLVPPATSNISKEIGINEKEDILHHTILDFEKKVQNALIAQNHDSLIEQIRQRYADLPQDAQGEAKESKRERSGSSKKKHHHKSKDKA